MPGHSLSTKEACERLGVTPATLYAYVSRGLIRSEPVEGDHRARRYRAEDVAALTARKEQRRNPAKAAEQALNWGTPVLESALTLITEDSLFYRGYDALHLARTRTVEEVAALLWTGTLAPLPPANRPGIATTLARLRTTGDLPFAQRLYVALAFAAEDDWAAYTLEPAQVVETGSVLLRLMANTLSEGDGDTGGVADVLARRWRPDDPAAPGLISAALVLCADHELSASSFTARVVASAGSNPYRVVIAGLAALEGARHGGTLGRVEALLRDARETGNTRRTIGDWLRRGERLPGFGHHLYPHGDPRARLLTEMIRETSPNAKALRLADEIADVARELLDLWPNVDFALTLLADVLDLPRGAAFGLFALGRTVGWIAHAIEQYSIQPMIRPRARYVGVSPRGGTNVKSASGSDTLAQTSSSPRASEPISRPSITTGTLSDAV